MDDGYLVGPREVIFDVLAEFANWPRDECGCNLNVKRCKMQCDEEEACEEARREGLIPNELRHLEKGCIINNAREKMRGINVFNVPVGEEGYVETILTEKARNVEGVTN